MSNISEIYKGEISRIVERLDSARRVLFITGAGLSAESGLPTYRGIGGLYERNRTEEGYSIEEVLSGSMFEKEPLLTWKYLLELGMAVLEAKPNSAHRLIAEIEEHFRERGGEVWVLSQNIDGFHHQAGSKNLLEIHGTMHRWRCTQCEWTTEEPPYENYRHKPGETAVMGIIPPRCPKCGGIARPDVVLFEELLPGKVIDRLQRELDAGFDVIFTVGTSAMFPYISSPVHIGKRQGALTVEVNPGESQLSGDINIHLKSGAGAALDAIWNVFLGKR